MFSYDLTGNPIVSFPRLLIGDTADLNHIFEDEEITAAYTIQAAQFQSGMLWSGSQGQNLPASPVSYLRVAALLLKALAGNKARMMVSRLLDANLTPAQTAKALRDQANDWLEQDDNAGAFIILEQCTTGWSFLDRFYRQVQRQTAQ